MNKVFVYGSLRKEMGANHLLGKDTFTCNAVSSIDGCMVSNGAWPAVVLSRGPERMMRSIIIGEVYTVPDSTIGILNAYEGYPDLFECTNIHTFNVKTGIRQACLFYYFNPNIDYATNNVVTHGDWVKYTKNPVESVTYEDLMSNEDLIQQHMRASYEQIESVVEYKGLKDRLMQSLVQSGLELGEDQQHNDGPVDEDEQAVDMAPEEPGPYGLTQRAVRDYIREMEVQLRRDPFRGGN